MNILSLDTEGPRFDDKEKWRGNAYGDTRKLVCYSVATEPGKGYAYHWNSYEVDKWIEDSDLIVGFNFKHDLTWMRKCDVDVSKIKKIWDVSLAEFVLDRQQNKYPSLDETCAKYGIEKKLDIVKTEYWDKGIDTCDIPWSILSEYAAHDADITLQCYHAQLPLLTKAQKVLVSLMCQDLCILQEMEWNGLNLDEELCAKRAAELEAEAMGIQAHLARLYPDIPINFNSTDQLSAFLYGGTIVEVKKEHVGFFKTGAKVGEPRYRNVEVVHTLPRIYTPLRGTELDKPGLWSTAEPTILKLKGPKKIKEWLLRLAKIDKLNGTYYKGLPKLREEMRWPVGKIHGTINQVSTGTGRLSAVKPNQQNFASDVQEVFISEYE